jgi:hypothetical protein
VKRYVLTALLVLGLGAIAAPVATPAAGSDAKGPACGNITDGDGSYTGTSGGAGTVDFSIQLQAPACSTVTYSLFVTDTNGNAIASSSSPDSTCTAAPGGGCAHFSLSTSSSPGVVCIYATTAIKSHVVDYAPNANDPSCAGPTPSISAAINGGVGASGNFG